MSTTGKQGATEWLSNPFTKEAWRDMNLDDCAEERVVYQKRFQGIVLDLRGRPIILRYDCCGFVKCQILLDEATSGIAFTSCSFEDCNIESVQADERRGVVARNNVFKPPIEFRKVDLERRLASAFAARGMTPPLLTKT